MQCSHKGQARSPSGDTRLTVSGNGAVTFGMEAGISFAPGSPAQWSPCPFHESKSRLAFAMRGDDGGHRRSVHHCSRSAAYRCSWTTRSGLATNPGDPQGKLECRRRQDKDC